ncbi:gamma interferon inducible lysosomal thiol reductase [Dictyocaulus viviparus]|uniref:Gamma interferon inducible lysosomal thiol reductase n=1 Tax=Dictyocaulus viviparus TaxID=29172 RepID=A0A0D8Y394_DICVI|nr:gamma interferon inducible lysosomal thiol reductase [Dictyocaulus viviparus]
MFRFIHQQLMKAWSMLSHTGRVELTMIPFGKARCVSSVGDDFLCTCQHGENECLLNQLMNCVIERIGFPKRPAKECATGPHGRRLLAMAGQSDLDSAMSSCVEKNVLLDKKWAKECATGPHGRRLLAMAGTRTALLNPPLSFVPWIMIDGERNSDALYDLTENLCKKLNPAPEECLEYLRNLRKS